MLSKAIWHYFLLVPLERLGAANAIRAQIENPDMIEDTFRRYLDYYVADFVAANLNSERQLNKQRLDTLLDSNPQLRDLLWVLSKNEYHPSTPEEEKGIVVDSRWTAFPVGSKINWELIEKEIGTDGDPTRTG